MDPPFCSRHTARSINSAICHANAETTCPPLLFTLGADVHVEFHIWGAASCAVILCATIFMRLMNINEHVSFLPCRLANQSQGSFMLITQYRPLLSSNLQQQSRGRHSPAKVLLTQDWSFDENVESKIGTFVTYIWKFAPNSLCYTLNFQK